MRVFVDVPQSAAGDLMAGATSVTVQSSDGTARSYPGRVARTSQAINVRARTPRRSRSRQSGRQSGAGPVCEGGLGLPPRGLVQVPAAALLFRSGGPQVARVGADNRITFVDVGIARDDGNVRGAASGVAAGERLALNLSSQAGRGRSGAGGTACGRGPGAGTRRMRPVECMRTTSFPCCSPPRPPLRRGAELPHARAALLSRYAADGRHCPYRRADRSSWPPGGMPE